MPQATAARSGVLQRRVERKHAGRTLRALAARRPRVLAHSATAVEEARRLGERPRTLCETQTLRALA
jgi:hypothetical protein